MSYPTMAQMQRVEAAARELEEAMRACEGASFEVHYGAARRRVGEKVIQNISDGITVVVTSKVPYL